MEFRANPQHYSGRPRIERVVLKFAKGAALTELMSGNVDAVTQVDPAEVAGATSDSRFRSYYSMAPGIVRVLYWRNDHPLFKDRRVRRALTLAIDRRALLGVLRLPPTLPIVDGIPTGEQLRRREYSDPLPYDSGRARALLEETGWRDTDGDGIRERDGRPFRFTAIARGEPGYQRIAIFVQEQLRRIGVRMEIQMLDGAVVSKRVGGGDFEAAFSRSGYAAQWLPAAFGEKSVLRYRNPRIVDLIERLAHTPDPNARDAIHRELGEIVQADVPLTFLTPQVWTVLAHRRVRGLSSPWHSDPVGGMDELWLENTP